jgi:hypothetical protein
VMNAIGAARSRRRGQVIVPAYSAAQLTIGRRAEWSSSP